MVISFVRTVRRLDGGFRAPVMGSRRVRTKEITNFHGGDSSKKND
ncbi:hypothetical protein A35_05290 [Coxiella burnetii 'MSU Goat Q177']|nr:hypothetical protein [Coxiella burnetii]APQ67049.1 hypothetical protein A35_05290 [Coxiella burnetii 'MSU Goat Q177']